MTANKAQVLHTYMSTHRMVMAVSPHSQHGSTMYRGRYVAGMDIFSVICTNPQTAINSIIRYLLGDMIVASDSICQCSIYSVHTHLSWTDSVEEWIHNLLFISAKQCLIDMDKSSRSNTCTLVGGQSIWSVYIVLLYREILFSLISIWWANTRSDNFFRMRK